MRRLIICSIIITTMKDMPAASSSASLFYYLLLCRWMKALDEESRRLEEKKEDFMHLFTLKDFQDLREGWRSKKERVAKGLQFWGFFIAVKPTENPSKKDN